MNDGGDFMVVGVNKAEAIDPGSVDFGAVYTWGAQTVIEWPEVGGFKFVEVLGVENVATDTEDEVTLRRDLRHRTCSGGSPRSQAAAWIGHADRERRRSAYFSVDQPDRAPQRQPTCDFDCHRVSGKVAA
jgi:hypothetical protein